MTLNSDSSASCSAALSLSRSTKCRTLATAGTVTNLFGSFTNSFFLGPWTIVPTVTGPRTCATRVVVRRITGSSSFSDISKAFFVIS